DVEDEVGGLGRERAAGQGGADVALLPAAEAWGGEGGGARGAIGADAVGARPVAALVPGADEAGFDGDVAQAEHLAALDGRDERGPGEGREAGEPALEDLLAAAEQDALELGGEAGVAQLRGLDRGVDVLGREVRDDAGHPREVPL